MTKSTVSKRSRGYCFTVNNYNDDDIAEFMVLADHYTYGIVGFEVGLECKTPHMQCYVYNKHKISWSRLRKQMSRAANIDKQHGTKIQAILYSMKDCHFWEFGERPRQGKRNDLDVIKYDLKKGRQMLEIADHYFPQWCQYRRSFDAYNDLLRRKKYDTMVFSYTTEDLPTLYEMYNENTDRLLIDYITDECFNETYIQHAFYSKRYRYIFIPKTPILKKWKGQFKFIIFPIDIDAEGSEEEIS